MENQEEEKYDSTIFEQVLKETSADDVFENLEPEDITESINFEFNDSNLDRANCSLIAYGIHVDEDDEQDAYNQKKNPDKAVDIFFDYPDNNLKIEIFLDTNSKEWDSWINGKTKMSPEQMGQFFNTKFYGKLRDKLENTWPCDKDDLFKSLIDAIHNKKYCIDGFCNGDVVDEESGRNDFGTGEIDPNKSREKNAAGKQIRSRSGRKYIQPSDFSVKHDENEAYFCWPDSKGRAEDPEFRWSQWSDWHKIKPLCRMRWAMGTTNPHVYGLTISPLAELDKNRGFRGYDLTATPPLQYTTPEETAMMMNLSIVRKFLKNVTKRLNKYLQMPDEDILKRIGRPDKCTIDDIRKTKHAIKNALDAIRNRRADNYIYT